MSLLQINNLVTRFDTEQGPLTVIDGVSLHLEKNHTLGLVGESGCGKSITAMSIMRLLPKPAGHIESGEIIFDGTDLTCIPAAQMRSIRGKRIAMIFQDPMTSLNPVHTIEKQMSEVYRLHFPAMNKAERRRRIVQGLSEVGIPAPEKRLGSYPHQLSGGMRQRVMIAMALACEPDILIADEPTTALDVTVQAQILSLMLALQKKIGMAILFITHDLGVISEICDDVAVMYAGKVVEFGSTQDIFTRPGHPYTLGLLRSIPGLSATTKTRLNTVPGMVPALNAMPEGCRFSTRCEYATDVCREQAPPTEAIDGDHVTDCFHWRQVAAGEQP